MTEFLAFIVCCAVGIGFAAAGIFGGQYIGQQIAGTMAQTGWSIGGMLTGLAIMSFTWGALMTNLEVF